MQSSTVKDLDRHRQVPENKFTEESPQLERSAIFLFSFFPVVTQGGLDFIRSCLPGRAY